MILIRELAHHFEEARNPHIAVQQTAYIKDLFPFFGLKKPTRNVIQKKLFKQHLLHSELELITHIQELWELPEREYHLTAVDLAYTYKKLWTPGILPTFEHIIRANSWWDSVDAIASRLVGPLLQKYPSLKHHMDSWIEDENMWIRRSALIYQLSYKKETDRERLFRYCKLRMHEKEFFIRKAIGWSLRQYARINPQAVHHFVEHEKEYLAPLSYREARKHLTHLQ